MTARPQPGNPAPRMFRLAHDRALLNRMGFNNLWDRRARGPACPPPTRRANRSEHRQDQDHPGRRRSRRLPRQRPARRPAGVVPGGQRQLAQHTWAARPAGNRVAATHPDGRSGRDLRTRAGQDRARHLRLRHRRHRGPGRRTGAGGHRGDQHHGVTRRPGHPGGQRAWRRRYSASGRRAAQPRCCVVSTAVSEIG